MNSAKALDVWVVDDDASIRWVLERALRQAGLETRAFDQADAALAALRQGAPDVLVTDIRMPGRSGLEMLEEIRAKRPRLPVIVMTPPVSDTLPAPKTPRANPWCRRGNQAEHQAIPTENALPAIPTRKAHTINWTNEVEKLTRNAGIAVAATSKANTRRPPKRWNGPGSRRIGDAGDPNGHGRGRAEARADVRPRRRRRSA